MVGWEEREGPFISDPLCLTAQTLNFQLHGGNLHLFYNQIKMSKRVFINFPHKQPNISISMYDNIISHRLNVCVSPEIHILKSNAQCDDIWGKDDRWGLSDIIRSGLQTIKVGLMPFK